MPQEMDNPNLFPVFSMCMVGFIEPHKFILRPCGT